MYIFREFAALHRNSYNSCFALLVQINISKYGIRVQNQPGTYAGGGMAKYEMSLFNVYTDVRI